MLRNSFLSFVISVIGFSMYVATTDSTTEENDNAVVTEPNTEIETIAEPQIAEENIKETVVETTWQDEIKTLASNADVAVDKYAALEKYMMDYRSKITDSEIQQFTNDIINDYESGSYLNDISNHEVMLTNIFKSYLVSEKSSDTVAVDFAFDYFQNMKYTYRGVDAVDSDAVKANESQMNRALEQIN